MSEQRGQPIDRYQIATGGSVAELATAVNEMMAVGWIPQGGVCVSDYQDSDSVHVYEYIQAMVRMARS